MRGELNVRKFNCRKVSYRDWKVVWSFEYTDHNGNVGNAEVEKQMAFAILPKFTT